VVAADAELRMIDGRVTGHPRGAGTHARILGRYVRERHVLSLMDGVRKLTLLPAQRLENVAPAMKRKGRVQLGADADLTVFDPERVAERVADRATFKAPGRPSVGIVDVLVDGGVFVVRGERLAARGRRAGRCGGDG
jgi:dihydroorotase